MLENHFFINFEIFVLLNIFVETVIHLFQDPLINKKIIYFIRNIFCGIINVFSVTFDQFNVLLLNIMINLFQKLFWPQTFEQ